MPTSIPRGRVNIVSTASLATGPANVGKPKMIWLSFVIKDRTERVGNMGSNVGNLSSKGADVAVVPCLAIQVSEPNTTALIVIQALGHRVR